MFETVTDRAAEPVEMPEEMPDEMRAPESPFAALVRRREEMGLTLEDVAQQLKFAPRQIEALEAADFARLPTGTFARGMLRSYARLLKLDAAPMLSALGERIGAAPLPEQAVVLREPVPFADGGRRVNLPYILFSLGVLIVVGALAFEWMRDSGGAAKLAFVPAAQTPPASQTLVSSIVATPGIATAETAAHVEPDRAPAGGRRMIGLRFERESWVEITDRAGHRLISQLNPAGSEQSLEGVPPFDVVVGNAQHVKLTYDGRPIDLMPYVKVEVARLTLE
jgi:cytoskeleton protein RodZ